MNCRTLLKYNAPPHTDRFRETTIEELKTIQAAILDSEASALQTEESRNSWEADSEGVESAIAAATNGWTILVALEEDGYYFAVEATR